jgi:hypothetical protein
MKVGGQLTDPAVLPPEKEQHGGEKKSATVVNRSPAVHFVANYLNDWAVLALLLQNIKLYLAN